MFILLQEALINMMYLITEIITLEVKLIFMITNNEDSLLAAH